MLENCPLFDQWREGKVDAVQQPATPLSLLTLCVLQYIGRRWTLEDLSENSGISEEIIRVFIHKYIEFGSTVLLKRYVGAPKTAEDAAQHTPQYESARLPGCIISMDATHILLEKVVYRLRQSHLGFKSSHTARTYNITVNNCRKLLATTTGHRTRWNDNTVVLLDNFAVALNEGTTFQDVAFELNDIDSTGSVYKQKYTGAWLTVENGYLNWATTVLPMKTSTRRANI
jgi:hypothetical protein